MLGVIAMFASLLILLVLPITDTSRIRGLTFRPIMRFLFWVLVVDFFILMWLGSEHPNSPFVEIGQIASAIYFVWFLIFVPVVGIIENSLFDIGLYSTKKINPTRNTKQNNKL